jgi:aspartyl-tRNA(Asn)/glutamyl-tRNA(Gln) amidotransferase subunit C
MSKITRDNVAHIAKLARLQLDDAKLDQFTKEFGDILAFIDVLQEVDTTGVEPLKNVTGLKNMWRDDEVRLSDSTKEELLGTSGLPIVQDQIQTPSAIG